MCRTCVRNGNKLIFSTRDPDEKPVVLESLNVDPKRSSELTELFDFYYNFKGVINDKGREREVNLK